MPDASPYNLSTNCSRILTDDTSWRAASESLSAAMAHSALAASRVGLTASHHSLRRRSEAMAAAASWSAWDDATRNAFSSSFDFSLEN